MNALVTIGQGVGNLVMATPLIAAVRSLGYAVDALVQCADPEAAGLLRGWEALRHVYVERPRQRYNALCRTLWHRQRPLGLGPEFDPGCCDLGVTHEVLANLGAARALGFVGAPPAAHCECDAPDGLGLPERYAVIAPEFGGWATGFWDRKAWPHWEGFAARLLSESDLDLVVLGVRRGAEVVVAIDNGLAHVAAALGRPVCALFGATSEAKNRPWGADVTLLAADRPCRPCQLTPRWAACAEWRCMEELTADAVWQAVAARARERTDDQGPRTKDEVRQAGIVPEPSSVVFGPWS